jgi:hypothetical protein
MMQTTLEIRWQHSRDVTESSVKSTDTGKTIQEILKEIEPSLTDAGITVSYIDEVVSQEGRGVDTPLLNGQPFRDLYTGVKESHDYCHARSRREEFCCHPLGEEEQSDSGMTEFLIRKTILLALETE